MAGRDVAMAEAQRLKAHLERYGIRVSIELQQGRGEWHVPKYMVMNHHTATRKGGSLTPALGICKNGRTGIPGPLCNGYGGYDGVFRIICMGLANHPGAGGPITIDGVHVPRDSMRSPSFGIEWEGGYHTWTAAERRWMGTVNVAITAFYRRPLTSQLEHLTWAPTRKIDRLGMTRDIAINDARNIDPDGGFLMALSDQKQDEMYEMTRRLAYALIPFYRDNMAGDGRFHSEALLKRDLLSQPRLELIAAAGMLGAAPQFADAVADAVIAKLPPGDGGPVVGGPSVDELKAAVRDAMAEARYTFPSAA